MLLRINTHKFAKILTSFVGTARLPAFQSYSFLFLSLTLISQVASASILQKSSTAKMTREAKEVQIGQVVSTWTSPDPDQKMYFTYVKIRVEKTLKGKPAQEILLRQPGGDYKDPISGRITHQKVFGMESFQKGERGLFFITHANDGAPAVMFQGKQQIIKDEKTGLENVVKERSPDVEYVGNHLERDHHESMYAVYDQRPLSDMVMEVQKAVNAEKGELNR